MAGGLRRLLRRLLRAFELFGVLCLIQGATERLEAGSEWLDLHCALITPVAMGTEDQYMGKRADKLKR